MPSDADDIGFSPVGAEHYQLLGEWLGTPHVRQWWGEPETELGYIRDMVEGRDSTRPFLIMLRGEAVGYIQAWSLGDAQAGPWAQKEPWVRDLPAEAVGVDLSIGEPSLLSRGIGTRALKAFVSQLRQEGHEVIVIDPDPANGRAVRAYRKAGFRPIAALEGRYDGVLLMQFHPNEPEIDQ